MKNFLFTALLVVVSVGIVLAIEPASTNTEVVDTEALFVEYQKAARKVAELEATHTAVDATDPATAKHSAKSERKLNDKRAHLLGLKEKLTLHGVDVAAKELAAKQLAEAQANEKALHAQFNQAWIAKLQADGRLEQAAYETAKASGVKPVKPVLTPQEKAQQKIEKLKLKIEREEFRLRWLAEHQQAANTATSSSEEANILA